MRREKLAKKIFAVIISLTAFTTMTLGELSVVYGEEKTTAIEACEAKNQVEPSVSSDSADLDASEESEASETSGTSSKSEGEEEYFEDAVKDIFESEDYDTPTRKLVDDINANWLMTGSNKTDLRATAGQEPTGYNVVQGCCTDGNSYAYFAFENKTTLDIKIAKIRLSDLSCVEVSQAIDNLHGNDMTYIHDYNGEDNDRIAIVNKESGRTSYLTLVNPNNLSEVSEKSCKYWNYVTGNIDSVECYTSNSKGVTTKLTGATKEKTLTSAVGNHYGFSSIAYDGESGRLAITLNSSHDLLICNLQDGNLIPSRYIKEKRTEATLQGMDADRDYIYVAWSSKDKVSEYNFIEVYDWKGNYVGKRNITKECEIETIFHTGSGDDAVFYAPYHYSYNHYYQVTQREKTKWKKVRKRVKWVKLRIAGRTRWIYKNKFVWTYKYKYTTVTKSEIYRDAYLMKLGKLTKTDK